MTPRLAPMLFVLLLAPLSARAQAIVLTEGSPSTLSRIDCEAANQPDLVVRFTAPANAETERVFVSRSDSCPKTVTNAGDEIVLVSTRPVNVNDNTTIGRAVTASELFDLVGAEGETCGGATNIDQQVFFCVLFTGALLGNDLTDNVAVRLDTIPPATPENVRVSPLNEGLLVEWDMPTDVKGAARYRIHVTPPTGAPVVKTFEGSGLRRGRVDGLVNDTEYTVQVTAVDDAGSTASAGNESPFSEPATGTPVPSVDFWAHYHDQGGQEQGGCASTGAAGLVALLALVLLRRRAFPGLAAAAVVASLAAPAQAQDPDVDDARMHSPRIGTFELRTGPYYPNVDDEPGLTGTPFADVFKSDSSMLWRAEVGLDLIDWVGRLGIGGSIGWTRFKGKARLLDGSEANDDTTFAVLPLTAVLTYRADFFDEWWGIPLVPYAKVGYGFVRWWTELDGKPSSDPGAGEGSGWARGLELSGGLQLVLDGLEREQAAELDQDFGINSTSLFFDATWVRWKGNPLLLQDTIFSGGVLIAF